MAGAFGWRGAYLGMAALPLFIGLPAAFFFFREPSKAQAAAGITPSGNEADDGHSFRNAVATLCFWQITIALVIVAVAVSGVLVHALPLLTTGA